MTKAIIDIEFIYKICKGERYICGVYVGSGQNGDEIFGESWDVTYNLKGYIPHACKARLELANPPKYRTARGEVGTKYRNWERRAKQLGYLQLKTKKFHKCL